METDTETQRISQGQHEKHTTMHHTAETSKVLKPLNEATFAGRLGGNQEFLASAGDLDSDEEPDSVPGMTLRQQLSLRSFRHLPLWKAAIIECFGKLRKYCVTYSKMLTARRYLLACLDNSVG